MRRLAGDLLALICLALCGLGLWGVHREPHTLVHLTEFETGSRTYLIDEYRGSFYVTRAAVGYTLDNYPTSWLDHFQVGVQNVSSYWHATTVAVPYGPFALALGIFPYLRARRAIKSWASRRRDQLYGRCLRCGYDLRATPGRCPGCGEVVATAKGET